MYAQVVTVDFTDAEAAIKGLGRAHPQREGEPRASWPATGSDIDDSHGTSIAVFDTEEHARATAPPVGGRNGRASRSRAGRSAR